MPVSRDLATVYIHAGLLFSIKLLNILDSRQFIDGKAYTITYQQAYLELGKEALGKTDLKHIAKDTFILMQFLSSFNSSDSMHSLHVT